MRQDEVDKYKLDSRTKDEFIKDLERGLTNESYAIRKFEGILNQCSAIENPTIVYVGSEEEGKVAMDGHKIANVDIFPDYLVRYKTNYRHRIGFNLIEVKVCNPHSPYAYFKKKQLEQYAEIDSVLILFVMGFSTKDPKFILIRPQDILGLGLEPEEIYGKETFKCHVSLFNWDKFKAEDRRHNPLTKDYLRRN